MVELERSEDEKVEDSLEDVEDKSGDEELVSEEEKEDEKVEGDKSDDVEDES